ncbi:class I SAM-dependent methyltransferase [Cellulomonas composti]|uniref:16S RNA G1207 methylase RsmC n=1 Tax=Cellulomonas composti TaxID=266130 RepID=A0A511JEE0_9CELL|nr:methyltransferase [Cellulomonas composti]GEL96351.1 16S RNA G1207 methylase RsmC [Cellulomonas composti]
MAGFTLDALRRRPDVEGPNLVAADATDRLVLDEAAALLAAAGPGEVVTVGDRYGALTLGAVALHGVQGARSHQDLRSGERALALNAEGFGLTGTFTSGPLDATTLGGALVVLLQLPRSLDALDEVATLVAAHADPGVMLVAGGRVKHMTVAMNDVLGRSFAQVRPSLARQKSRVLVASGPRVDRPDPRWPVQERHDDLGITVCAHGAAFAGTRIDLGTRVLLGVLEEAAPGAAVAVDLGCGTGVLATVLATRRPGLRVVATDDSAAAVASAAATAVANGVADRVRAVHDDAAGSLPDGSADLVVLNPPFHVGAGLDTALAHKLFDAAARLLRPGGELWTVWNSHLQYRPALERAIGPTRQVVRDPRFTVTASTRRSV